MADNTHNTKIVISGKDDGAVSLLARIKSLLDGGIIGALGSVRNAISKVMSALGVIGLAVNGVTMLVDAYKKMREWVNRAATAARELREELSRTTYADSVSRAAESYKRLNKEIAECLRLENERNEISGMRKANERDLEDADAERRKQIEISKLDPGSDGYAEKKREIERRYQVESSDRTERRAREDIASKSDELYRQAGIKDREADELGKQYKDRVNNSRKAYEIYQVEIEKATDAGEETRKSESVAKAKAEYDKAVEAARKIKEEMIAATREARSIRNKAAELAGGNLAANIRNEANKQRIENEAKAEDGDRRKKEEERAKAESERQDAEDDKHVQRKQNLEDRQLERKKQEDISALDPNAPDYGEQKKEVERLYEIRAAQDKRDRAKAREDDDIKQAEEEISAARKKRDEGIISAAEAEAEIKVAERKRDRAAQRTDSQAAEEEFRSIVIRQERERRDESSSKYGAYADKVFGQIDSSRPKDRLTAMGLGSGSTVDRTAQEQAANVKTLVQLLKEQVGLSRQGNNSNVSVYSP